MHGKKQRANSEEALSGLTTKLATGIATGIVTVVGAVGFYKFGQSLFQDQRESSAFASSAFKGTPEYYAYRLRFAIEGLGTDEEEIFAVAIEVKTQSEWKSVQEAYSKLYRGDVLMKDLQGDLNQDEYFELVSIINDKKA